MEAAMTNPTADEARRILAIAGQYIKDQQPGNAIAYLRSQLTAALASVKAAGLTIADLRAEVAAALTAVEKIERVAELREEAIARDLTAALARADAAEKERDELLKHCTALERESFENLIKHEKWQEREAVYKSQIEAGAKRIEAAEKALEPFAKAGAYLSSGNERDIPDAAPSSATFAVGDLRRAARALSAAGGQ
jgi:chromosome segregation ATPase